MTDRILDEIAEMWLQYNDDLDDEVPMMFCEYIAILGYDN